MCMPKKTSLLVFSPLGEHAEGCLNSLKRVERAGKPPGLMMLCETQAQQNVCRPKDPCMACHCLCCVTCDTQAASFFAGELGDGR